MMMMPVPFRALALLLLAAVLAAVTGGASAIQGGPSGAFASATVVWTDPVRFTFKNVVLKDTSCDGHSVHFTVRLNGRGPDASGTRRENSSGCGSTVQIPNFSVRSFDEIPKNVALFVCVNRRFKKDICGYTTIADNPFI